MLLENFAPGVMDRLGVGAAALMAANPRLIYASATGYGLSGPERDNLAMDITIQAASGAISVTGFPDGPPVKAGPAIADFLSGTHLYGAIVTALFERERTGRGRLVEVAMIETMFPTLASNLGMVFNNPQRPLGRTGNRHGGLAVSPYNVYPARTAGSPSSAINDDHWAALLRAMDRRGSGGRSAFRFQCLPCRAHGGDRRGGGSLGRRSHPRRDLRRHRRRTGSPPRRCATSPRCSPTQHMQGRGMIETIDHPQLGRISVPGSPLRYHGTPQTPAVPSPALGADTEAVLGELLGLSAADVAALRAEEVV